ncbi:phenoloxidase-activating factor 2 [Anabrus simplex]|uniref:phenoloxidase-activating factor 2 n=1 Tax=Anabrus simplex TaxID=316456 RepID=UPI0035A3079A
MRPTYVLLLYAAVFVCGQDSGDEGNLYFGEPIDDRSSYDRCTCDGGVDCYCVQAGQCLPNGTLNYEAAGAFALYRSGLGGSETAVECSDDEVCCQHAQETTTTSTTSTTTRRPARLRMCKKGSGPQGTRTEPGEFPWMLAIFSRNGNNWQFQCGASLLTGKVALTAAHCVKQFKMHPKNLRVRAGAWDLSKEEDFIQELDVAEVKVHEHYVERKLHNDIALLIMDGTFKPSYKVGNICIPHKKYQPSFEPCIATGWGHPRYGSILGFGPQLKKIEVSVVPRDTCQSKLRKTAMNKTFHLHDSFMCAGGGTKMDTCTGDGGGPLVCEVNGFYHQFGLVSWGAGCGREDLPGVYVDISKFAKWIRHAIPKD